MVHTTPSPPSPMAAWQHALGMCCGRGRLNRLELICSNRYAVRTISFLVHRNYQVMSEMSEPPCLADISVCRDVPGLFWHPKWVYLVALYSVLLNGAALRAQILPYGVLNSPKGGSEKKYRARPNRLWGHSKGRLGAPEPHLSGPIPPRIRPERGKPLLWPLGAGTPQQAKKKVAKWRQT